MKQTCLDRFITSMIWGAFFVLPAYVDHLRGKSYWMPGGGFSR